MGSSASKSDFSSFQASLKASEVSFDKVSTSCSEPGVVNVSEELLDMIDCIVELVEVKHMRKPMIGYFRLYHDYLKLVIEPVKGESHTIYQSLTIKAEKGQVTNERGKALRLFRKRGKISVDIVRRREDGNPVQKTVVDMKGSGRFPLSFLLEILKSANPVYDLSKNNCWLYVHVTLGKLIKEIMGLPETSSERKAELEKHLSEMRRPKLLIDVILSIIPDYIACLLLAAIALVAVYSVAVPVSPAKVTKCIEELIRLWRSPVGLRRSGLPHAPVLLKLLRMLGDFGRQILETLIFEYPKLLYKLYRITSFAFLRPLFLTATTVAAVVVIVLFVYKVNKLVQRNRACAC